MRREDTAPSRAQAPACATTQGRRESNQDRVCALSTTASGEPALLLAVADGMGGMQAGEEAAELALATVRYFAAEVLPERPATAPSLRSCLEEMFQAANRRIWGWSQERGLGGQVGTTLACCLVLRGRYLVAHSGDSRCYYVNDYEARQLTGDHTQVQEMVEQGLLTPQAALNSPLRHQLTSSLGEPAATKVELSPPGPHFGVIDEACALMVCSDGLHAVAGEADIYRQFHGTDGASAACANLVSLAVGRGSTDNISVAAVEVGRLRRRGLPQARLPPVEGSRTPNRAKRASGAAVRLRTTATAGLAGLATVLLAGHLLLRSRSDQPPQAGSIAEPRPGARPAPGVVGDTLRPQGHSLAAPLQPAGLGATCALAEQVLRCRWSPQPAEVPVAGSWRIEVAEDRAFRRVRQRETGLPSDRAEYEWALSAPWTAPEMYVRVIGEGARRGLLSDVMRVDRAVLRPAR